MAVIPTAELARELKRRNPDMTLEEIARVCRVTKQAIHQHMQKPAELAPARDPRDLCRERLDKDGYCASCGWDIKTRSYRQ